MTRPFRRVWRRRRFRFTEIGLACGLAVASMAWSGCSRAASPESARAASAPVRAASVQAEPAESSERVAQTADGQSVEDRTVLTVSQAIRKNQLTSLTEDCLAYRFAAEAGSSYYTVEVRENHHFAKCGGDPQTSPRLMTVRVMKDSGAMSADSEAHPGQFKGLFR